MLSQLSPKLPAQDPEHGAGASTAVVSRPERRGLFAQFSIITEAVYASDYSPRIKWLMTFVVAFAASTPSVGSAILLPSLSQVAEGYDASLVATNLSIALFMLAMGIFPLWWSFISETYGHRTTYISSFALFSIFCTVCAVSTNLPMFVVFRTLSGGAAASAQSVGAGTLADIWEPQRRGKAMGFFYLGPMCGPLFAPIIGGALGERWGWRSTQWMLVCYGGLALVLMVATLSETSKRVPERNFEPETSSKRLKSQKVKRALHLAFVEPLAVIAYLRFPPVLLTVDYSSLAFGAFYVLNISLQDSYAKPPYEFSTAKLGLVYIPSSLGFLVASLFGGKWCDRVMIRDAEKAKRCDEDGNLQYRPEDRMRENAWIAALLFPVGMIWHGWAIEKHLHWIVPMIGSLFFGIGAMLIFSMASTMLTEFLPHKPSAGVAANNLLRNIFSCTGSVAGQPLLDLIGNGWLFTAIGTIAAVSASLIWAMRVFGQKWRDAMDGKMAG